MICFVCALEDTRESGIGICRHCGASLCERHLEEVENDVSLGHYCMHAFLAA